MGPPYAHTSRKLVMARQWEAGWAHLLASARVAPVGGSMGGSDSSPGVWSGEIGARGGLSRLGGAKKGGMSADIKASTLWVRQS